ncbi:MAG: DegV family protein [Defluviitaleaceae bacterium]|nr:DegV family protein [Defluviitaleaceae bacterium]
MGKLQIVTDSCCNLSHEAIDALGLEILSLAYVVNGVEHLGYVKGQKFDFEAFHKVIGSKTPASTQQATPQQARELCEPILQRGDDILYVGFSSGLSGTYDAVCVALKGLKEEYPDCEINHVDGLSATGGQGVLVELACKLRDEGKNGQEIAEYIKKAAQHIHHHFTVDDLFYLKRGGRLTAIKAIMGTALNVKPVMTVSKKGKLVPTGKAKGRKKSLEALVENTTDVDVAAYNKIWAVHANALEDANYCAELLRAKHPNCEVYVTDLEAVISTHTGPGVIAICYLGINPRAVE